MKAVVKGRHTDGRERTERKPEDSSPNAPRRLRSEAGFTLLELLVAVSIIAIVVVAQVAPFQQTIKSRDHAEAAIQNASAVRLTLLHLSEELDGALALDDDRGRFTLVDRSLDGPSSDLRFATTSARRVHAGPRDPVEIVRYYLERTPEEPGTLRLMKQQLPSVVADGVEPVTMVVLDGVTAFEAQALTAGGWTDRLDAEDGLPRAVRLRLTMADRRGPPTSYRTTVTLPLGARS